MLPLYTCYSSSHAELFELMSGTAKGFDLRPTKLVQRCSTGQFQSTGWGDTMLDKAAFLVEACLKHEDGSIFAYSDVDVIFNPNLAADKRFVQNLGALAMAAQSDGPAGFCTGLFVCRGSPALTAAWATVRAYMVAWNSHSDQTSFNQAYLTGHWPLPVGLLTTATSLGAFNGFHRATGAQELPHLDVKDLNKWSAFHASWVLGVEEKRSALQRILRML